MSIRNLIFGVSSVTVSDLIRYDSLLQNATDVITKCDSYFVTKHDRSVLQNLSGFLLQNAIVLLQNAKMRQLLQNITFITNCDSTILSLIMVSMVFDFLLFFVFCILLDRSSLCICPESEETFLDSY